MEINNSNKVPANFKEVEIQSNTPFSKEIVDVMIQNAPISMYLLEDSSYSNVNAHFCHLVGYTKEELLLDNFMADTLFHPDDLLIVQENARRSTEDLKTNSSSRVELLKKDGSLIHVEIHETKATMDGKAVTIGTVLDVTEEVKATLQLKENQERFKSLFDNNPDAVFTFDLEGNFINANAECETLSGYTRAELLDLSFIPLIASEDLAVALKNFENAKCGSVATYEITLTRKDGKQRNLEVTNFPMKSIGEIVGVYGIAKDITDKLKHQKLLEDLVFYDTLTKLPNRKLFEDRLCQVFKLSDSRKNQPVVLFLDLDRFKFINDSLGHHVGDEFLKIVAERLLQNVRHTDTVGRFAGDEFAILLPTSNKKEAIVLAERLNLALAEPFEVMGHSLTVSTSIGIAFSSGTEDSVEEIMKKADTAMYYTKKYGRNNYTIYTEELDQKTTYKLTIEQDLKSASQNQEFVLHYQPITNLKTGELSAMEALVRWNHPELGIVPPDHFIPILEESGQIVSLGKWVLETACAQNKTWQDEGAPPFKICVNISPIQLQHPNFIPMVKSVLETTGLDAKWLELEVTESILIEDMKRLKECLTNLKELGLSMSIDDFGTGYTSLSYLQQFSFDRVKIDRSFIQGINTDSNSTAITSTIISLAHKLKMEVVAEGIEDETQLAYLQEENCDEGQGYYFSRPLPAELHAFPLSHNTANGLKKNKKPPLA
ncbi:diguanylate cyclase/phosphodiesterase [Planomicrobium soli]|uniref:Diguanylate cyclase/phosphodiesterase n=1 Tax=Planomicrobium soli TaxID=1176648 RepID=A0A2P8H1Y9_9BACL|nr:GGDEF domain-containing phosphodiesterase [Planomicrobium soli]PSL40228.1 diguanylate cyclase/phosphodiesterase [Planomicrobium soli]